MNPLPLLALSLTTLLALSPLGGAGAAELEITNDSLHVTFAGDHFTVAEAGSATPFATCPVVSTGKGTASAVAVEDPVFGSGHALVVTFPGGERESAQVFPHLPLALFSRTLVNADPAAVVINKVSVLDAHLTLAQPANELITLGTGGLQKPSENSGSYAWLTVADPKTRAGVVGGWLTHERSSGVVIPSVVDGAVVMQARAEYGHLRLHAHASLASETFALGWFSDARVGMEAWASAVAKRLAIVLPPQPTVYCTWYADVHGGSGDEQSTLELATFAAKNLKPFGLSCVQIDDGWQRGDPKGNGPRKWFTEYDPQGPYRSGMKATAEHLAALGFKPGLWYLPFAGNWNDPAFADHQDWFVKKADGKPYDTMWGGTCFDLTQREARAHVQDFIHRGTHDWGFTYLKIDGLYTGAGASQQYVNEGWKEDNLGDAVFSDPDKGNIEIFRDGLRLVRAAAGPGVYILGCCAAQNMRSYGGSFGLVDAMRSGADNTCDWNAWTSTTARISSINFALNRRIWYNDPDPTYVRARMTDDQARFSVSWMALCGQVLSLSDWLPTLPPERLDMLKRAMPAHQALARPVDIFTQVPVTSWQVTDPHRSPRFDVVGQFNWAATPAERTLTIADLGLDPTATYVAFDFWNNCFVAPFSAALVSQMPPQSCRVLALRTSQPYPQLLSTSRHITQGMIDVLAEHWDAQSRVLSGRSRLVGEDPYELRIIARDADRAWTPTAVAVSAADHAAKVTISRRSSNGLVRVQILSPVDRDVDWSVHFDVAPIALTQPGPPDLSVHLNSDEGTVLLGWAPVDGVTHIISAAHLQSPVTVSGSQWADSNAPVGTLEYHVVAVDWAGHRSPVSSISITSLASSTLGPLPPKPEVALSTLTAVESTTGYGSVHAGKSVDGNPLRVAGKTYAEGMGVHAISSLVYDRKPEWRRFVAVVGIDDEVAGRDSSVRFHVIAEHDGTMTQLAASPILSFARNRTQWRIDTALPENCTRVHLEVDDAGDGISCDHADWVDAGFLTTAH